MQHLEKKLEDRSIRPTAMRIMILHYFMKQQKAVALPELENAFETADKSTLFRTLKTFEDKKLIHGVDDGTGAKKYALCMEGCTCAPEDQHYHFHCKICSETFCLTSQNIPAIELPRNFRVDEANLVLKGICAHCNP